MVSSKTGIRAAFTSKAKRVASATRFVKLVLIYGGAVISACVALFPNGFVWPVTGVQLTGLLGAALVALGGYFITFTEDSAEVLNDAQQALFEAEEAESAANEAQQFAYEYEEASIRLTALYTALSAARGLLERAACTGFDREVMLVKACMDVMRRDLRVALGFDQSDTWTICIYQRLNGEAGDPAFLKCVAHDRTVDCHIDDARTWKEGVGVGGMALAKDSEVVAPDILDPAAISLFQLSDGLVSAVDRDRYRSLVAVPIHVGTDKWPWGVVVASSNRSDHFGYETEHGGVQSEEGARALAGIVALAVAQSRKEVGESLKSGGKPVGKNSEDG